MSVRSLVEGIEFRVEFRINLADFGVQGINAAIEPPPHGAQPSEDDQGGGKFCPVHGATLADPGASAHVHSAFLCLYPCQPNIGRYWPLLAAHSVNSLLCCLPPTAPANQLGFAISTSQLNPRPAQLPQLPQLPQLRGAPLHFMPARKRASLRPYIV